MNRSFCNIALSLCFFALASCTEKIDDIGCRTTGNKQVTVSLNLIQSPECGPSSLVTKAVDDPESYEDTQIRNMCILQYAGTDDSSPLVGEVHYLRDDVDPEEDEEFYLDFSKIRLAESEGQQHTIVFLANTFKKIPRVETLGEMLSLTWSVKKEADIFGYEGESVDYPEGNDFYQRMNAIAVSVVTGDTELTAVLRRPYSHVRIHINNAHNEDNLQIKSAQVLNVPMECPYVSDYRYLDPDDVSHELKLRDKPYHESYDTLHPVYMNYPKMEFEPTCGSQDLDFDFYMPCNQRWSNCNEDPYDKNKSVPSAGATFIRIEGSYGPSDERWVSYEAYLGANDTNDYNIDPNTVYDFNFEFEGVGDLGYGDERIRSIGTDFDIDANSYMLHQPGDGAAQYSLNVVHRPNLFYGERYGLKRDDYIIGTDDEWKVKIVWCTRKLSSQQLRDFMVKWEGTGDGSYMDDDQRLIVNVPSDMPNCAFLVEVYKKNKPSVPLWTWLLWVTDYAPETICGTAPTPGRYIYPVVNGEVHRYGGTSWEEGKTYENAFIMDRDLGAIDDRGSGSPVYYTFGRSDPSSVPTAYTYKEDTYEFVNQYQNFGAAMGGNSVYTNWINTQKSNSCWADPYSSRRNENEEIVSLADGRNNKSFTDPCPPGWRVPTNSCFSHLLADKNGTATVDHSVNFLKTVDPRGRGTGTVYFPLGYLDDRDSRQPQCVFFPYYNQSPPRLLTDIPNYGVQYAGTTYQPYWHNGTPNGMIRCVCE